MDCPWFFDWEATHKSPLLLVYESMIENRFSPAWSKKNILIVAAAATSQYKLRWEKL